MQNKIGLDEDDRKDVLHTIIGSGTGVVQDPRELVIQEWMRALLDNVAQLDKGNILQTYLKRHEKNCEEGYLNHTELGLSLLTIQRALFELYYTIFHAYNVSCK